LDPKIADSASGHLIGKDHIRLLGFAPRNAYFYETLEREEYSRAINGKYIKKYYPSVWVDLL
jgi:hypothetical protein